MTHNDIGFLVELANNSKSGDLDIAVGKRLLEKMEWGLALRWLEQGIKKGHLSNEDDAQQTLCETYHKLGRKKAS